MLPSSWRTGTLKLNSTMAKFANGLSRKYQSNLAGSLE
jgi:hypothetical protein